MYTLFPRAIGGRNFLNIYFLYLSMLRYCLITIGLNQCLINKLSKATNLLRWLLRRGSPLPIPNRVVKPACADGTAICGRVCRRLSFEKPRSNERGFLFLWSFFGKLKKFEIKKGIITSSSKSLKNLNQFWLYFFL